LYYIFVLVETFWNPQIINTGIYNLFLVKLNNIKLNVLFITKLTLLCQVVQINLQTIIISIWALGVYGNKSSTINTFYQGYVKIHPPLQYISSLLTTLVIVNIKKIQNTPFIYIISGLISAFILGSLWALFQSIWGYYWSNDSIEYILLFFMFFIGIKMHKYHLKKIRINSFSIILCLFLLVCLRLNLLHTKHNFFIKNSSSKYFVLFFQTFILFKKHLQNKFKQNYLYLKSIMFFYLFFIVFNNKLNQYWVKQSSTYLVYWTILVIFSEIISINKYKIIHVSLLIFLLIYNLFNTKYISIKYNLFILSKKNNSLHLITKRNFLVFNKFNKIIITLLKNTQYSIKNNITINFNKTTLKKLCNYF